MAISELVFRIFSCSRIARMKLLGMVVVALLSGPAVSGTLNELEIAALKDELASLQQIVERGDAESLVARTHSSILQLVGGPEAFRPDVFLEMTRNAMAQIRQLGVVYLYSEFGRPTQTYSVGSEEICFVPWISVLEIQGKKVKSTSFMVAIRGRDKMTWKYLDGSGFRKNPEVVFRLFPALSREIVLPPNHIEMK